MFLTRPSILLVTLFAIFILVEAKPNSRRSDAVAARRDSESESDSRDEDLNDEVKRDDSNAEDEDTGAADERETRSGSNEDEGGDSRSKRTAVKSKKSSSSSEEADLCPLGTKYKLDCNRCFCNPTTGVTGCTMMACYKIIIPTTTSAPIASAPEQSAPEQSAPEPSKST